MAANIVPITSLSPASSPPADAAIRAVVTLIWPYSSSTKQCALLLADPDFRLRNKKGQVRVQFYGPSAEAVALGKLGIGDAVLLELKGAAWAESREAAARTPGRCVDGELAYAEHVGLQKAAGEWIRADGIVSRPQPVQEAMQTPVAQNGGRVGSRRGPEPGSFGGAVQIYSSPAFARKTRLSGHGFGDGYDPFTEEMDSEGPRKRARMSFRSFGKWRLAGRTPSPEKEEPMALEADTGSDADMEDDAGTVEGMAPPSLPRLQMPEVSSPTEDERQQRDGPSTPNLRPVPSSTLPLPSPFPAVDKVSDPIANAIRAAAADALSTAASTSQQSLGPSQSLPDTAEPDDADAASPTGIYAHNGAIAGTYRQHVPHPEWLSDTEEDESLHEEHLKNMRDEYNHNEEESDLNDGDVEEIIDNTGEGSEDSSEDDLEEVESKATSKTPAVVDIDHKDPTPIEGTPHQVSAPNAPGGAKESDKTSPHQPLCGEEGGAQEGGSTSPGNAIPAVAPHPSTKHVTSVASASSRKRKVSPSTTSAPETPAKLPIGIFGMDGTSDTMQGTPQSERDRIMARTYDSLFGFSNSPALSQPFVLTPAPAPDGRLPDMGRAERATKSALRSPLESEAKSAESRVLRESGTSSMTVSDAVLAPRNDTVGQAARPGDSVTPAAAHEPSALQHEPSQLLELSEQNELHEKAMEATQGQPALPQTDVEMADEHSISDVGAAPRYGAEADAAVEQLAPPDNVSVVILEAAIEGDVDMDAKASEASEKWRNGSGTATEPAEASSTIDTALAESLEVVAVPGTAPVAPAAAPSPPQVGIIELDGFSGHKMEQEDVTEEPHYLPRAEAVDNAEDADGTVMHKFPGSPTEVDSDEEIVGSDLYNSLSASPQVAVAALEDSDADSAGDLQRIIPETLQTKDPQSIHLGGSELFQASAEKDSLETLQTQDAQSILPIESRPKDSRFVDQLGVVEKPASPPTQSKNTSSLHYSSFQTTISAASDSYGEDRQTDQGPAVTEAEEQTKVVDLLSSSPVLEGNEHRHIDADVQPADVESPAVEDNEQILDDDPARTVDDEQMSDAEALSPTSSVAQRAAIDAGISAAPNAIDAGVTSKAVHDDEQMAQANISFASPSSAQQSSLHMPDEGTVQADASDARHVSSNHSSPNQRHSKRLVQATEPASYQALPMSPVDSQETMFETQPIPLATQLRTARLPPTPQLTQGDSLAKEVQIVVERAGNETTRPVSAQFDPPCKHTRSSVEPNVIQHTEPAPSPRDPPPKYTRSSVEPTLPEAPKPKQITPDRPSRRTRSSADLTVAEASQQLRNNTPDPPSRHGRSSVEPTITTETVQSKQITLDPPSRHTRSSVEPTMDSPKTPARRSARRSQTYTKIEEEPVEERKAEEEDTIAVLSPFSKTPVRKSPTTISEATMKGAEMEEAGESMQKRSPAKKSLTSRLSNVPEVISAWFSPRRSTRLHGAEQEADEKVTTSQPAFAGLSTDSGYYSPLSNLSQKMNSQTRTDNAVDIIAVVTDSTKAPECAKAGPKDYFTCFKVWDPSLENDTTVLVEVFRPWKATLPMAEVGDVVLLRGFAVKSRKRQPYLMSSETSGWCVWRYAEHEGAEHLKGKQRALSFSGIREEIKGPPVELGKEERDRVGELRAAWGKKL